MGNGQAWVLHLYLNGYIHLSFQNLSFQKQTRTLVELYLLVLGSQVPSCIIFSPSGQKIMLFEQIYFPVSTLFDAKVMKAGLTTPGE